MAINLLSTLVAGCALFAPAQAARRELPDVSTVARNNTPSYATRFMVEFSDSGSSKFRKRDGSPDTEGFYEEVKNRDLHLIPGQNFTSELFHGASFDIVNGTNETLASLEEIPDVARLWPVHLMTIPKQPASASNTSEQLTKRQDDAPPYPDWANIHPHLLTNVDKAHELGYDGSGVIIAIVDSGVEYNHPALGGGFGPGFKFESGWDLVGPDYLPGDSNLNPGPDPQDCLGHGTHVAGIVGSSQPEALGVAYNARFRSYKVFGCFDGTGSDIIIAAFLQAYEEGADVISGSLGNDNGFAESPMAIVINKIAEQGVLVVTAAGNSGELGPFLTSNTANAYGSLSVGSVVVKANFGYELIAKSSSGEERTMTYVPDNAKPWDKPGESKAYKGDIPRDFDVCGDFFPNGYKVPDDDVLVIRRGEAIFCLDQFQTASSYLMDIAKWVIFYNIPERQNETPERFWQEGAPIGFATINYIDGQWIEDEFAAGNTVSFEFPESNATSLAAAYSNTWSSWGTTLDARLKPEISAPGDNIMSTYLLDRIDWIQMPGTSMACPYISGVGALFFQSAGGRAKLASCGQNPAEVARRRIINSGQTVGHSNITALLPAALGQQGAGLVDAMKVITYTTTISPPIVHLNDTDNFAASHTITVKNRNDKPVTYKISHEAGSTALSREFADAYIEYDTILKNDQGLASVKFSTEELVVPAKGSATFTATFTEPNDIDPMILAQYGGAINVVGSNDEAIKVNYIGIKGSLKEAEVWEIHNGVPIFFDNSEKQFADGHIFPFPELPLPYYNYLWSSREYSFDVVRADWKPSNWVYPPTPGENNFVGSTTFFDQDFGVWRSFPIKLAARADFNFLNPLGPTYAHGAPVEPGEYRLLARAIKTYGEWNKIEDWHVRLSNRFIVAEPVGNATVKA
ncbi:peptidase S8/S53 domain-containing protein [Plectosphaerella plurivora]|uniref:Peptidase S8/S53 domain-containing protein n=1 Tax=Plectosphaerella plurivora TaxID=936078 RepID=A0A9P9A6G3_9PEZI|nr:peptidase S8/S53 domain-containing protein [Plectosphaerella plurivora]